MVVSPFRLAMAGHPARRMLIVHFEAQHDLECFEPDPSRRGAGPGGGPGRRPHRAGPGRRGDRRGPRPRCPNGPDLGRPDTTRGASGPSSSGPAPAGRLTCTRGQAGRIDAGEWLASPLRPEDGTFAAHGPVRPVPDPSVASSATSIRPTSSLATNLDRKPPPRARSSAPSWRVGVAGRLSPSGVPRSGAGIGDVTGDSIIARLSTPSRRRPPEDGGGAGCGRGYHGRRRSRPRSYRPGLGRSRS